jgi:hypothetical protein
MESGQMKFAIKKSIGIQSHCLLTKTSIQYLVAFPHPAIHESDQEEDHFNYKQKNKVVSNHPSQKWIIFVVSLQLRKHEKVGSELQLRKKVRAAPSRSKVRLGYLNHDKKTCKL